MKRNMIWSTLILSLMLISCSQDYLNEYMVKDKVYLNEFGLKVPSIFNWGIYTHDVYVIKGGKGFQAAQLKLVTDENLLNEYNQVNKTSYKMMPQECYTLKEAQVTFGKEEYRKSFKIDFDPAAISKLVGTENQYALPCRMEILNNSIEAADETKMTAILVPNVRQPYLKLFNVGLMKPGASFIPSSDNEYTFITRVQTNYHNQWDLTYTLEIDPAALDSYNQTHGTAYKLLPEAAYEFDKSLWTIPAKWNEQYVKIKLKKQGLITTNGENMFGEYVLPVRLASVSMHGIDPNANVLLYAVSYSEKK